MKWRKSKKVALARVGVPAVAPVWRSRLVLVTLAGAFAVLIGRAAWLQMWNEEFLKKKGDAVISRDIELPGTRGRILDRNGEVLAVSSPVKTIFAIPTTKEVPAEAIGRLAKIIDAPVRDLKQKLAPRAEDAPAAMVTLKRNLPPDVAERALALKIPGVGARTEYRRFYPAGDITAHVLGHTDIKEVGREGVERIFEAQLAGKAGTRTVIQDRLGHIVEDRVDPVPARDGRDLQISIDGRIQALAHRHLRDAVAQHRAESGAVLVLDVRTGEILASASLPTSNPNDRERFDSFQARNRPALAMFEPGSTLKPFTIALALESGKVSSATKIQTAPGRLTIGKNTIRDAHPAGVLTVAQIIQKSSNVGSAKIALDLQPESMWRMFHAIGFGTSPGLGFPGEIAGRVRPHQSWKPIEQATMSYGHGIGTSLVQLARAYSIFALDGDLVPVTLVRSGEPTTRNVISARTAREVRKMLEAAVSPEGTAPRAQIPGYRVAGKTGTAHKLKVNGGGYEPDKYISSFVGFAPVSQPRLVVAVMIEEPRAGHYYGGLVAAPVFANIMQGTLRVLGVPYDAPVKPIELPAPGAEVRESL